MAKNSQMRKLLLCGGIILVVLFFFGVFKMKEGFACSERREPGCKENYQYCSVPRTILVIYRYMFWINKT